MKSISFKNFDTSRVPSPCFVVDKVAIENNLQLLERVHIESGAKILLALKAFSMFSLAPLVRRYLQGTCASGYHEAQLGREEFTGEVHTLSSAYKQKDFADILALSDHVIFNSFSQWNQFKRQAAESQLVRQHQKFGLRINPLHSEGQTELYDPCAPQSRLGIPFPYFKNQDLECISGLHFHTLCEHNFEPLNRTLNIIEAQFEDILPQMEWVNFGGGHHITADNYDVGGLVRRIKAFKQKYNLEVYLEPGEAIAINSGVLVTEVLDLTRNIIDIAILDSSATCHMPDTLEMPYKADIFNAGQSQEKPFTYRLGGQSCLAGDIMGDYSFDQPLEIGQRLMFDDMAHYTMVKTTTFNGIQLPAIAIWDSKTDELKIVREFGYHDFKSRLS